jgi:hypothetical protein
MPPFRKLSFLHLRLVVFAKATAKAEVSHELNWIFWCLSHCRSSHAFTAKVVFRTQLEIRVPQPLQKHSSYGLKLK